jgi:hypothetical protein
VESGVLDHRSGRSNHYGERRAATLGASSTIQRGIAAAATLATGSQYDIWS